MIFNPSFNRGFEYVCKLTKNKKRQCQYCSQKFNTCKYIDFAQNGFKCRNMDARREAAEEAQRIAQEELRRQANAVLEGK